MKKIVSLLLCAFTLFCAVPDIYAADGMFLFRHNDHDVLVIGTIIGNEEDCWIVDVEKTIVSAAGHEEQKKAQLKPEQVRIANLTSYSYYQNYDSEKNLAIPLPGGDPQVGDCIVAGLNDNGDGTFSINHLVFRVDSTDYETLRLVLPLDDYDNDMRVYAQRDAALVEAFIHSDGQVTEFTYSSDGEKLYTDIDGERVQIFPTEAPPATPASTDTPITTATPTTVPTPSPSAVPTTSPATAGLPAYLPLGDAAPPNLELFTIAGIVIAVLFVAIVVLFILSRRRSRRRRRRR